MLKNSPPSFSFCADKHLVETAGEKDDVESRHDQQRLVEIPMILELHAQPARTVRLATSPRR